MERGNPCNWWLHSVASYHFMVKLIVRYIQNGTEIVFFFLIWTQFRIPSFFRFLSVPTDRFEMIIKAPITFDRIFFFFLSFILSREINPKVDRDIRSIEHIGEIRSFTKNVLMKRCMYEFKFWLGFKLIILQLRYSMCHYWYWLIDDYKT